ncbi:uncharacterized protein LOC114277110 isoform X2 [Camellia sinensis]|uniref:uncharacterized protein LOC114277110 isoform X2 n=1 Tax=Camellia sinensis TaxID=4442 RepID=UPI001036CFF1|nr:uncharacterized protein LOC114277110 isoform X2 [Camellia sinensis]
MYYLINAEFCRWETLLSRSWKKTLMLPRRLRETGGSNRVAHIGYFAQSNLSNYVFWFSHSDRFSRSLLRRMLSRKLDAFLLFWNVCLHLLLLLQHLLFESLQLVLGQGLFVLAKLIDSLALSTTPNNKLDLTGLCCV